MVLHEMNSVSRFALGALGLMAGIIAGYFILGVIADRIAKKIPDHWETSMFSGAGNILGGELAGKEHERYVNLFAELLKSRQLRKLNYTLYVSDEKLPNAFAAPGGSVTLTKGFMDMVQTDGGISMVMAHELGHHYHRHALQRLGRTLLISGVMGLLMGGDPGILVSLALGFAENSYSQKQEYEADAFGLRLLQATRKDTKDAFEFFEKIHLKNGDKSSALTALFSSHPYTPDRIERLRIIDQQLRTRTKMP